MPWKPGALEDVHPDLVRDRPVRRVVARGNDVEGRARGA